MSPTIPPLPAPAHHRMFRLQPRAVAGVSLNALALFGAVLAAATTAAA